MNLNGALRTVAPQMARRCYASHAAVSHGHGHGYVRTQDLKTYDEAPTRPNPCNQEHPVAPVATYDDFPVPVLSYKEGYEKPQKAFNTMLAVSVVAFTAMTFYVWKNDVIGLRQAAPPKWYTQRKIGKGLGDI